MTRLQVVALISFDQTSFTKSVVAHVTGCIQFERCSLSDGIRQRHQPDDDVLYLWTCQRSSYDRSLRDMLSLFLVSHHVFWLLPSNLDVESLRLLRHLQQLRSLLSFTQAPPSISFVVPSPSLSSDNLSLRFRAQTESTIRALITPICSNPPLFQTPIQKAVLIFPSSSGIARVHTLQAKRFRQAAQAIALSVRSRTSPIPANRSDWETYAVQLWQKLSIIPVIVPPVVDNLRLLWDELLPGFAETVIRLYNENGVSGLYGDELHQHHARKSLEHIRSNLPSHVYSQLEPVLLSQLEAIWTRSGRRKCSAVSVTGRSCIHAFHQADDTAALPASFGDVPRKRHSSGFLALHSCSCGSVQANLPDPFDLLEVQSDLLTPPCCQDSLLKSPFSFWRIHTVQNRQIEPRSCSQWFLSQDEFVVVAFELECESGHSFFHNFRDPVAKFVASPAAAIVRDSYPPTDIPVMLRCQQCRNMNSNAPARLRRMFVDTANTSCRVYLRPQVSVRCKRPEYHLKAAEERDELSDSIDPNDGVGHEFYEMPSKAVTAVTIPLAFPSPVGSNRAYRTDAQYEVVLARDVLFLQRER